MAEGARLESVCVGNGTAGSNPALSAIRRLRRQSGESGSGFGLVQWIRLEPGQAGNGAALRAGMHVHAARTHWRTPRMPRSTSVPCELLMRFIFLTSRQAGAEPR